jgi:hypothetical protein
VPSDAKGAYTVQVTLDTGPLAGKIKGRGTLSVAEK